MSTNPICKRRLMRGLQNNLFTRKSAQHQNKIDKKTTTTATWVRVLFSRHAEEPTEPAERLHSTI